MHRYRHTDIQTYIDIEIQTYRHTSDIDIQTYIDIEMETYRHT